MRFGRIGDADCGKQRRRAQVKGVGDDERGQAGASVRARIAAAVRARFALGVRGMGTVRSGIPGSLRGARARPVCQHRARARLCWAVCCSARRRSPTLSEVDLAGRAWDVAVPYGLSATQRRQTLRAQVRSLCGRVRRSSVTWAQMSPLKVSQERGEPDR